MKPELFASGMELGALLLIVLAITAFTMFLNAEKKREQQREREQIKKPCLGCDAGHAVRDDLHLDSYGQPYMLCQRTQATLKSPPHERRRQAPTQRGATAREPRPALPAQKHAAVLPGPGHLDQ